MRLPVLSLRAQREAALRLWLGVAATALAATLATLIHAAPAVADGTRGWAQLWANQVDSALVVFTRAVEQDAGDVLSRRGLILAKMMRGHERLALVDVEKLTSGKSAGALDFLLLQWMYRVATTSGMDERTFQAAYKRLADARGLDPLDRRAILSTLAEFAISNGDTKVVAKVAAELHRIDAWSILGPFDNISMSGHHKQFLTSFDLDTWQSYSGKDGLSLRWYRPLVLDLARQINFQNHFESERWITAYAGCEIAVRTGGTFLLSLSQEGAIAAELDGQEFLRRDVVGTQKEYDHFEVDLAPGRHTLLVKVSGSAMAPGLAAGLSRSDGSASPDVGFAPLVPGRLESRPLVWRRRPLPLLAQLEARVASDSLDAEANFWLLLGLTAFDLEEETRAAAKASARRFSNSALLQYASAHALQTVDEGDAARACMKRCTELDPAHAQAALYFATEEMRKGEYTLSDSTLHALAQASPDFVTARLALLGSYRQRNLQQESGGEARSLASNPGGFWLPLDVLAEQSEALGNHAEAARLRRQALESMPRSSEFITRFVRAANQEDAKLAGDQLEKLCQIFPDSPMLITALASTKLRAGDVESGLSYVEEGARLFPNVATTQLLKGEIDELRSSHGEFSRRDAAIDSYERALALRPGDFETRDKLRGLQGLSPVSAILAPADLDRIRADAPQAAQYPGADACVLLDQFRRIVFEDGSSYGERALVVKVFTNKGVQQFSSLPLAINPILTDPIVKAARTLKADGREVKAQMGFGAVAFQSVAPGDIVELHYGASAWNLGTMNRQFWDSHAFQWSVPCRRSLYELLVPKGRRFHWKLHHAEGHPVVVDSAMASARAPASPASSLSRQSPLGESESRAGKTASLTLPSTALEIQPPERYSSTLVQPRKEPQPLPTGFDRYTWTMENVAARRPEALVPPYRDVCTWLDVSTIASWHDVAAWYADLSEYPSRPDPTVRAKVEELVGALDERQQRIARLCNFVTNDVPYEDLNFQYSALVPERASHVLRSMYGDCKDKVGLLRSMLAAIDVPSSFALVNPTTDGETPFLPSVRFRHAILAIPTQTGYWFVDPTANQIPAGRLPSDLLGSRALVIGHEGEDLVDLPEPSPGETALTLVTDVTIHSDHEMRVRRREICRQADEVAALRHELEQATPAERDRYLTRDLGVEMVGAHVAASSWQELDSVADSVVVAYEAIVEQSLTSSGAVRVVCLPWRTRVRRNLAALVAVDTREEPLLLHELQINEVESLSLTLPAGWKITGIPESQVFACPFGSCSLRFDRSGDGLRAQRELQIRRGQVSPQEYPQFKDFFERVIRAQEAPLLVQAAAQRALPLHAPDE